MTTEKTKAEKLLDNLPNRTTWDKTMFELGFTKKTNENLKPASEVKSTTFKKIKSKLLKIITGQY